MRELFRALPARPLGAGAPPRVVARVGVAVDVCEVGRRRAVPVLSNQTCARAMPSAMPSGHGAGHGAGHGSGHCAGHGAGHGACHAVDGTSQLPTPQGVSGATRHEAVPREVPPPEVLANRGLVIRPRRRRLREFAEDSVPSSEGLDVPSPPMPQGRLPLHLLRQEVLGPEPHALMRGISSPLREGGL